MENRFANEGVSMPQQTLATLLDQLTPRQLEVLALLCEGLSNKMISRRLNIACGTVKVHVAHILRVFNVASRLQAVLVVRSLSLALKSGEAGPVRQGAVAASHFPITLRLRLDDENAPPVPAGMTQHALAVAG